MDGHVGAWVEGRFDGLEKRVPRFRSVPEHGRAYGKAFDFKLAQVELNGEAGQSAGRACSSPHGGTHLVQHCWRDTVDKSNIHAAGGEAL